MQSSTVDDQQPLLPGGGNSIEEVANNTKPMQAYRKGALGGVSAKIVQVLGLVFVVLIWGLVFSVFPWNNLPLFGYHPIVQSLAILLLLQSITTLQPTKQSQPSQKQSAFKVHQIINLLLVLPLLTIGVAIMWYLHDQPGADHFISWHGKIGFTIVIWAWLQLIIGVAISSFHGKLVGGPTQAKALYKWHRISGYILLPLFLVTAYLGAAHTSWSSQSAGQKHHIAVMVCLIGIAAAIAVRVQPSKLPHL